MIAASLFERHGRIRQDDQQQDDIRGNCRRYLTSLLEYRSILHLLSSSFEIPSHLPARDAECLGPGCRIMIMLQQKLNNAHTA